MGSSDHSVNISKVYSSVYNRIGIPIHNILSPVLTGTYNIYLSVDMISVYLKVAMHQWSVLSPLLFAGCCPH